MSNEYLKKIKTGPTFICFSCGGLFFERSMTKISNKLLNKEVFIFNQIVKLNTPQNQHELKYLCFTCYRAITKSKIPQLCLINGLHFSEIPECLVGITKLEERMVSPRIPFMQIKELGD